jgi:hypothetical protein
MFHLENGLSYNPPPFPPQGQQTNSLSATVLEKKARGGGVKRTCLCLNEVDLFSGK